MSCYKDDTTIIEEAMIVTAKIGAIEFEGDEVRIAVVKTGGKLPRVLELQSRRAVYENPEERFEALTSALNGVLDALKAQPATYVLCVPGTLTIVRALTIPFKGIVRVTKAVPFELEPHLAFPLDELLLDFNVIREAEGATEVLAVGTRRGHLEEQMAILQAAGVEAEMAGVDVAGLTALWMATQKNAKGLRAVLHVRGKNAVLAVVYNKALAYFRLLYFGEEQLRDPSGTVCREIQNTIRAFMAQWSGDGEIDSLAITGVRLEREQVEHLEDALGMPVFPSVMLDALKGAKESLQADEAPGNPNRWEAAIGAAYSAGGGGLPINMMKDAQQIHGAIRGVVAHLMFSACLALLFLLGCAWYFHENRLRNEVIIEQIRSEIDYLEKEIEAMAAEGLGEDVDIAMFGDPPVLDILNVVASKMPHDKVAISELRVAQPGARGGWIEISGSTTNAAAFNEAFEALKQSELFQFADDTNLRSQGERTTFRVRAFRPEETISESEPES
ncbi:MAG: pilus assembly protein PilM [Candidatus Hydrogenedentes bacterium]|nr:pilus assembly protein PilM [Candidatus Hydrogenedentota bacterium]